MNLKFEAIVQFSRKIIQLNVVIILKSSNEYHLKIIPKSGHKMDFYPALVLQGNKRSPDGTCCEEGRHGCATGRQCLKSCTDPYYGPICCWCRSCFPAAARVSLESGETITMTELKRGDRVKTGQ